MTRTLEFVFCLFLLGCGSSLSNAAASATQASAKQLDTPVTKQEIDDAAASLAESIGNHVVTPKLQSDLDTAEKNFISHLDQIETTSLSRISTSLIVASASLRTEIKQLVRDAIDEALSSQTSDEATNTIVRIFGDKFDTAIANAVSTSTKAATNQIFATVQASIDAARSSVNTEVTRLEHITYAILGGCAGLLILQALLHSWERRRDKRKVSQ